MQVTFYIQGAVVPGCQLQAAVVPVICWIQGVPVGYQLDTGGARVLVKQGTSWIEGVPEYQSHSTHTGYQLDTGDASWVHTSWIERVPEWERVTSGRDQCRKWCYDHYCPKPHICKLVQTIVPGHTSANYCKLLSQATHLQTIANYCARQHI